MSSYTDTHCHLNDKRYQEDVEKVLQRACDAQVNRILVPGYDFDSCVRAISLAETYPMVFAAVGIHPNDAMTWNDQTLIKLEQLASHPKVLAIGEIGLDYYRDRTPHDRQMVVFQNHLDLAAQTGKPVIIHNRQAEEDLYPVVFGWQESLEAQKKPLAKRPGILHAFAEDQETGEEAIRHHFYLGVGGVVTFPNARKMHATIAVLPVEALLLETDAPYLSPQAHRGERNEPAYIPLVANRIAQLQDRLPDDIAKQTTQNAENLLNWGGAI